MARPARVRVRLHPLSMREDRGSWIVGRVDTGVFIDVPPVGQRVITLLDRGMTVADVRAELSADGDGGDEVDVQDFVDALTELGFVAEIDDRPVPSAPAPAASLPFIRPRHVAWMLHPATTIAVLVVVLAAAVVLVARPGLMPGYRDLVWSEHGSLVLAGNAALAWTIIFLHELGHLGTARAAGAPARMSLGTRLQFLAAQTDVSGVWTAPRRTRITVYLAGIAVNLVVAAAGLFVLAVTDPGPAHHSASVVMLVAMLLVPTQALVFMRTDLYFLLQDLTGCRNLYADGAAHLRHLAARLRRRPGPSPTAALPPAERRAVHAYSVVLLLGTATCLTAAAAITIPAGVTLLIDNLRPLLARPTPVQITDAVGVFAVIVGFQTLWIRAWLRRHGHRLRRRSKHDTERR